MGFTIQHETGFTRISFFGTFVPSDAKEVLDEMAKHFSGTSEVRKSLILLDGVTDFEIGYSTLNPIANFRVQQSLFADFKSAFVAVRPIEMGIVRMWLALVSSQGTKQEIFSSVEDAISWLHQE